MALQESREAEAPARREFPGAGRWRGACCDAACALARGLGCGAAMRKKVDARIRTLVENCVKLRHRALFVIVGDKGRDQVVNLHYMLSKTVVKARPSVLWCYKKELHLSRRAAAGRRQPSRHRMQLSTGPRCCALRWRTS